MMVALHNAPLNIHHLFKEYGLIIKVKKGSHIFREGERAENIFFVEQGAIQISKETEQGKELTLRICGPHAIMGESAMFCKASYHSTSAKAVESSQLLTLQTDTLELLLSENPPLMLEYIKWLQTESLKHQSRLRDLMLNGKKGALFSTLIRLANTYGEFRSNNEVFIDFALTNTDIANLCATSREMINRMLNDLKNNDILSFEKGYITINNLQFLKDEISCENCPLSICRID
ncbi:Crp/Fnr family transcriptional regulator [Lysinibacillus sp. 3P01SB]|uniref:Crp/Fnr family transcriptional regulator n=1 Tax=Lysinibacillus sp. 3P01SB TaxID=3132284 RepID=UPI0039A490AC